MPVADFAREPRANRGRRASGGWRREGVVRLQASVEQVAPQSLPLVMQVPQRRGARGSVP